MTLRILVLTNMYPTEREPWFGSFVANQVEDLRGLGLTIDVQAFDGRIRKSNYLRAIPELRSSMRKARYDVIHAHSGLSGFVALAQRSVPVVTTFHGSETGYIRWQRPISYVVARLTEPIFVSAHGAAMLGIAGRVIPAGVDVDLLVPQDRAVARRDLGLVPDARYVLFPGARTNRRKRVDLFLAALAVYASRFGEIRPLYLEGVARQDVPTVINAADAMLMTSDWEGSPVALRECLACERPVVSVEVGDAADVLAGLPGCAVTQRDPGALADALRAAVVVGGNTVLRARACLTSRAAVAEQVAAVYAEVACA